jgi:hypothetical protein
MMHRGAKRKSFGGRSRSRSSSHGCAAVNLVVGTLLALARTSVASFGTLQSTQALDHARSIIDFVRSQVA